MMMIDHAKKKVPRDKKEVGETKRRRKENTLMRMNRKNKEECLAIISSRKHPNIVTKRKITMRHNSDMMSRKEGGSIGKFMQERELENRRLF